MRERVDGFSFEVFVGIEILASGVDVRVAEARGIKGEGYLGIEFQGRVSRLGRLAARISGRSEMQNP